MSCCCLTSSQAHQITCAREVVLWLISSFRCAALDVNYWQAEVLWIFKFIFLFIRYSSFWVFSAEHGWTCLLPVVVHFANCRLWQLCCKWTAGPLFKRHNPRVMQCYSWNDFSHRNYELEFLQNLQKNHILATKHWNPVGLIWVFPKIGVGPPNHPF